MLFERIESAGLAHYSYLVGDRGEALVIDPRRDSAIYEEMATKRGFRVATILETHRNEDYVIGSVELSARTGAEIWHADEQLEYRYGQSAQDGQTWTVGRLTVQAILSPGHTPGSMSYLLHDPEGNPWVIFTGDALFAGDVGRVDLLGMDRAEELAGMLHDTLFNKLLPLGDEVIVCPAHGHGSVCGAGIAERVWTTMGLERRHNEKLQHVDRGEFIEKIPAELERPPYFRRMEQLNIQGPPPLGEVPLPPPLSPREFVSMMPESLVLDTRTELNFGASHVPDALSIWLEGLPSFAGWFLSFDKPILLVNEIDDPANAVQYLARLGYDRYAGYLSGGMLAWHMAGKESHATPMVTVQDLCRRLDGDKESWILDVRSNDELTSNGRIFGAHHIHITQLRRHLKEIPQDRPIFIFCGSGLRSMIAASELRRGGWRNTTVVLGGLAGWNSISCPIT